MNHRIAARLAPILFAVVAATSGGAALAQTEPPDALVKRVSTDVLDAVKSDASIQAGDVNRIVALVDAKILPNFDFERMTASAAGPHWKDATAEQKKGLEEQFKILLVRVYSGALAQARDRTVTPRPLRDSPTAPEVVVRTQVTGKGEPVELDFRLEQAAGTWKIYDMNVGGVWLVDNYRSTFSQEIGANGIDSLIAKLADKNKAARG